ncbi:hypothetical protein ACLOAV_004873 [Pseudogymnoascus australis]
MDGVTTPVKGGTDTATELALRSKLHTPAQEHSHIGTPEHNHSASGVPVMLSAHSIDSNSTNSPSTFSIPSNMVTPLTPPASEDAGPKGQKPIQCEANQNGKDSQQSVVEILQSRKLQGSNVVDQRPSTPQPEADDVEFGTGSFVYPSDFKFSFVASLGQDSPTPRNVIGEDPNTTAKQHSARPFVPYVKGNDNSCLETEDSRVRDSRATKKAKRDSSSSSPTRSLSEDADQQLASDQFVVPIAISPARPTSRDSSPNRSAAPYPQAIVETADCFISSPQDESAVPLSDGVVEASHNSTKGAPKKMGRPSKSNRTHNKQKGSTPPKSPRRSPRIKDKKNKLNISAAIGPNVEESYFSPNPSEVATSQNLCEGVSSISGAGSPKLDVDEDEAVTDECQSSTTSGQGPDTMDREINSDTEAAEAVAPPVKVSKEPSIDTTKKAGRMEFEQYDEIKSPADIKIAILNVILQEDKKHTLDKEKGSVYIYKLDSSEGHVKIGKSKQKHGLRVKQWAQSCKLPFERIFDLNDKRFLHYGIVEKLVHAELSNERKTYQCGACKRKGGRQSEDTKVDHAEWFEVKESDALEITERWRGWLVHQKPYSKDGALRRIWVWKHGQLSEANTVDYERWVVLTWSDWSEYSLHRIDSYLDEELPTMLRSSLFINATLVFITRLWCISSAFLSSVFTIVILAVFLKYS